MLTFTGTFEKNNKDAQDSSKDIDSLKARWREKCKLPPHPPTGQLILVVYGDQGKTGQLTLTDSNAESTDKFAPGKVDEFQVSLLNRFILCIFSFETTYWNTVQTVLLTYLVLNRTEGVVVVMRYFS